MKYIVLDVESTNSLDDQLTYDLGFAVVDETGKVYEKYSYVVADIFLDKELMESAYFKEKIPQYWEEIKNGTRILATTRTIRKAMLDDIKTYGIKEVAAHNARFDYNALNIIQRWTTKSKYRYWFPYDTEVWDTMKMARDVIHKMPTYKKFCETHGFLTANGRLSAKAEDLYRFIIKDPTFVESHTGLEDVQIEREIMFYCFRQHKKMRKGLYEK